jgi:signal transduction histidine kinase/HAMP domain-containing protein
MYARAVVAVGRWLAPWTRNRLFRKYVVPFAALVAGALLINGLIEIYFTYRESHAQLAQIQREKANAAALRIEQFVREIEHQMAWTTQPQIVPAAAEQRQNDYVRLLRQAPPITEVAFLDGQGREQLRLSRLAMDVIGGRADLSSEPRFRETRGGRVWYGPVYFRKESEPYMTIAIPHGTSTTSPVTVAEVNLKFIWDVVSQIRVGRLGQAYVVDRQGHLIAHPDISLVLRKTDLSTQPHVQAARAGATEAVLSTDLGGRSTLVAHTVIGPLGWMVFVEQPLIEAFAPLRGAILRTGLLMLLGVLVAVIASLALARKIGRPIEALRGGAARIGGGDLAHRIDVRTKDELQDLGEQFNRMAGQLQESYATLEQKVEDRTRELTEALEQQTATGEILRVISRSPTDVQPVLDAVAESAARLCGASDALIMRVEKDTMRRVAHVGAIVSASDGRRVTRDTPSGRAIVERRTIHIADITEEFARDDYLEARPLHQTTGFRTVLVVPLTRDGDVIGVITIRRLEARPFTTKQIALVQTFAAQAVIAIENVRLFKELEARNAALTTSLEQQTATSEILRVISSAQQDVQPVFDTIVESAVRLCHATIAGVFRTDGTMLYHPANYGGSSEARAVARARYPRPLDTDTAPGIAILTRSVFHVPDIEDASTVEQVRQAGRLLGFRSAATVPMLREGEAVGAIVVARLDPGRFSEAEVELLKTFADQAVIAIENVRLFQELQSRTAELTQSVEELKALGEVGRTLSSTLDLPTVLDTILSRANVLAGTDGGAIYEFAADERTFHLRRATGTFDEGFVAVLSSNPLAFGEGVVGRAGELREPVQIPDIRDRGIPYDSRVREAVLAAGYRALLAVPLISEDEVVGALVVNRRTPGEFEPRVVDMLRTFGTQSALAIQNARLFREIEEKSRQLEAANRHKDEFLASMSHELRTPLNAVIGFSEVLLEKMFGDVNPKQEEYLQDILASGRHLLSLINDILDLAKIEAGRMELDVEEFEVVQAVDNAVVLVRERAMRKGLTLDTSLDRRLGSLRGDQRKIKQVLLNLLSNAVKFTPEGGRIEVRAQRLDGQVEISVTDTGIGIAPEDQEAVFEEFRQVGTDYAKKHEGTGLGLTLSRKFVELHGGRIWVKSAPGQGSTFAFTLPERPWPAS